MNHPAKSNRPARALTAICVIGVLTLAAASGCGSGDGNGGAPSASSSKPVATSPAASSTTAAKLPGEKVFKTTCMACHDASGKPNTAQEANPSLKGIWTRLWSDTNENWDKETYDKHPSVRLSDKLYKERVDNLKANLPEHYEANKARYEKVFAVPETDKAGRFLAWLECRIENGKFDAPDSAMLVPPLTDENKKALVEYLETLTE